MFSRWMLYNFFKMLLKHTPRIQDLANSTVWIKDSPTNWWILWDPSSLFPKLINPVLVSPSALKTLWRWLWQNWKPQHIIKESKFAQQDILLCISLSQYNFTHSGCINLYLQVEKNSLFVLIHESFSGLSISICWPALRTSFH